MYCPKCKSQLVMTEKRGFSLRNGIIGSMFFGERGFLAGFLGSRDIVCECVECGYVWKVDNLEGTDDIV